jgi:tetratricopeptide (TPR) repeat protein
LTHAFAKNASLATARSLFDQRRLLEAKAQILALPTTIQEEPATLRLMSRIEDELGDLNAAANCLDRFLTALPFDSDALFARGVIALRSDHQQLSGHAQAQRFFERAIEVNPNMAEAHFHLGIALQVQTRHVDGIPHYQRAIALDPKMIKAHYELAKAYCIADRIDKAKEALATVLLLDPAHGPARKDMNDLKIGGAVGRSKVVRFPNEIVALRDIRQAVLTNVLGRSFPEILTPASKVATFGSCFAGNVARALREAGVDATNTTFGEFVNSTAANRHYLDWVADGTTNSVTKAIAEYHSGDPNFSGNQRSHRNRIAESDIIVLTVGVAPCFFRCDTEELVIPRPSAFNLRALLKDCKFRTTTVRENVDNILHIIGQLRRINPSCTIVITLSPVPLTATFEYESAIEADCVSKSTLRVAVDEVLRTNVKRLIYWPSFEIVRWLGCYVPGMYGAEDGSTIHISESAIYLIVDLFINRLSGGTLFATAPHS